MPIERNIDEQNSAYWNESCGTVQADKLQLDKRKRDHLEKFDSWYLSFYPYLKTYIDELDIEGKSCLEIGVGLGTISRLLAKKASVLHLVDIANEPLQIADSYFANEKKVKTFCTSILDYSPNREYDIVVAVGSLHHTGDFVTAVNKVEELVAPGGKILIMVYHAFQPRRILLRPLVSISNLISSRKKSETQTVFRESSAFLRSRADKNRNGVEPPSTEFISRRFFENRQGIKYKIELNNSHGIPFLRKSIGRSMFLKIFSSRFGCDVYAIGEKNSGD